MTQKQQNLSMLGMLGAALGIMYLFTSSQFVLYFLGFSTAVTAYFLLALFIPQGIQKLRGIEVDDPPTITYWLWAFGVLVIASMAGYY